MGATGKNSKVKTVEKYRDRQGSVRYKGTSHLKKTEFLGYELKLW